jgi:hypothetical protein
MKQINFWNDKSFEISTYKFSLIDRINKTYNASGSDNTGLCTYSYNELGFRGDSINKKGFKVLSLGCSHTEGVGVNYEDTWPKQFCNLINDSVNLNFGCGGRSCDYIVRCLISYYDLLKPDLVLIQYPNISRREIYTEMGGIEPFMPQSTWGYLLETEDGNSIQKNMLELQNDNSDFINWYKNHLLVKYFLDSKKCNWLWNGSFAISDEYQEYNRFDGDFGSIVDRGVDGAHPGPNHNNLYANKLFNHIQANFPLYLSDIGEKFYLI